MLIFDGMARVLGLALAAWLATTAPAAAQREPYRFSPVNQWDINKTASYWNPIIQYVAEKSGVPM
jgi:phosphonate transport system substrate-binding protein